MLTHNLGYPRIGSKRELKKACENYWAEKISKEELFRAGRLERQKNWQVQKEAGIDIIPCNDFSFYDHVQDMTFMAGCIPGRYRPLQNVLHDIDLYFAMCRGYQENGHDIIAMEMTKWFDTNYHYIVPEFTKNQNFFLNNQKVIDEYLEQKESGIHNGKPVMVGPVSYLLLGKEKEPGFHRLDLMEKLLPVYLQLIEKLVQNGCTYLQLDEPYLVTEMNEDTHAVYRYVYQQINKHFPDLTIILATYFGDTGENLSLAVSLPVHILHLDLCRGNFQFNNITGLLPDQKKLSLGIVDGRNIWKNDFEQSLEIIHTACKFIGEENIWLAPSCSLLHCPYDIDLETNEQSLPPAIKSWMAFAKQKLNELSTLKKIKELKDNPYNDTFTDLVYNAKIQSERKTSGLVNKPEIKQKVNNLHTQEIARKSPFKVRIAKQNKKFGLPLFPTTTIGSFPQTTDVRKKRRAFKKGLINREKYETFIRREIKNAVRMQEEAGLDVLVHGEFERNDMVEYFGELLNGFVFTENGWVQSYGSRGVKPPVIYGDISRKEPMTVKWSTYAQSLTDKKMKGMLTGPVTMLQWSFVRDDQPRYLTAFQIALALQEEVLDLEKAGIDMIQIDEPALREGLPLKKKEWKNYLRWAVKAFRVCTMGVRNETQIHTHMCYSEFNDIIASIAEMDADVISIETSRSQMELLEVFSDFNYPNQIGPGVYDIHSPRIPAVEEMEKLLEKACQFIDPAKLWVNPDCGLKTRKWEEVIPALKKMVQTAAIIRKKHRLKPDLL